MFCLLTANGADPFGRLSPKDNIDNIANKPIDALEDTLKELQKLKGSKQWVRQASKMVR